MNCIKKTGLLLLIMITMLSACSSSIATQLPEMAMPLQPNPEQEYLLSQLTQIINQKKTKKDLRAQAFFERSNVYDSLGMQEYAYIDIRNALAIDPKKSYFYNLLGIYLLQRAEYDVAYQAFESAIELDPKDIYAQRNLGIALYYAGRYPLAITEFKKSYQMDPKDAYSVIWLYLAQLETSPMLAQGDLKNHLEQIDDLWGKNLIGFFSGDLSEAQLVELAQKGSDSNQQHAEKLTEAYFYIAKRYIQRNDYEKAARLLKICIAQNVYYFIEHRYALLELDAIYTQMNNKNDNKQGH